MEGVPKVMDGLKGFRLNDVVFRAVARQMWDMYRYGYMMKGSGDPLMDLGTFSKHSKRITEGLQKNQPVLFSELEP